jgi:NNP family nitrate/nitrite transporter-like MFS transporter
MSVNGGNATTKAATAAPAVAPATARGASLNLALATIGFMVNFWAWALIGPLGPGLKERLGLSFAAQSFLVAVPIVVGSLGRIPIGALTDKLGARLMFPAVTLATVVPVLVLAFVQSSYPALIVAGFFLGIGGTAFAVGVPLVSAWYPPARRGFALGVFGVGMGGTAIANFTTVRLGDAYGERAPFFLVALILVVYAAIAYLFVRDAPGRVLGGSPWARTAAAARLTITWQLCFLYAVGFGGFVAFSVYLPAYLRTAYHLGINDAALRTAGFVVLAVAARPVGGWLSDRYHPVLVLVGCFSGMAVLAVVQAFQPPLIPLGTIAFLGMAGLLGAAAGAVFALVGKLAPADKVGAVTGLVGAAGGLGGFVPPLIMGWVYGLESSYAIGLMLLSDVALAAAVYTGVKMANLVRSA